MTYVNKLTTHSWGQTVVRFYDPDGNLIEVGAPMQAGVPMKDSIYMKKDL